MGHSGFPTSSAEEARKLAALQALQQEVLEKKLAVARLEQEISEAKLQAALAGHGGATAATPFSFHPGSR